MTSKSPVLHDIERASIDELRALPIPGASRVSHLEENVAAAAIDLSDEEFAELDRAGKGRRRWPLG